MSKHKHNRNHHHDDIPPNFDTFTPPNVSRLQSRRTNAKLGSDKPGTIILTLSYDLRPEDVRDLYENAANVYKEAYPDSRCPDCGQPFEMHETEVLNAAVASLCDSVRAAADDTFIQLVAAIKRHVRDERIRKARNN